MRVNRIICDRCGIDASVNCDLVVPNPMPHKWVCNWWPWKNNAFDLCEKCAKDLLGWIKETP